MAVSEGLTPERVGKDGRLARGRMLGSGSGGTTVGHPVEALHA